MEFTELSLAHGEYGNKMETSVDLQLKHPLPSDWEQCLDLQSGRMYYVNRKTSRKSWTRPDDAEEHTKLDLELNMAGCSSSSSEQLKEESPSNMVALACSNCHLLVILCTTSPSCPNCKYVHSLKSKTPTAHSF